MDIEFFKDLENLAKEWRDFSREHFGRECKDFTGEEISVWCYFAENSDHTSVRFKTSLGETHVAFFNPVKFDGLTIASLRHISQAVKAARKLLKVTKQNVEAESLEEKSRKRQELIKATRQRLSELEGAA